MGKTATLTIWIYVTVILVSLFFNSICGLCVCVCVHACGGQVFSEGRIKDNLVGTTYISLVEIARMNAMSPDPEEGNIVTLPLHRPSRRIQGYIRLWVNLSGTYGSTY